METVGTFQGFNGTKEETGKVPQVCNIMFADYQSQMTLEG